MKQTANAQYVQNLFNHADKIFQLGFDEQGECTALAYSKRLYDRTAYVCEQMRSLGMQVRHDAGGNLFGLLPGKNAQKIMLTSHLDSVVNAGRYDGVLGIILPLELVRWVKDNDLELNYSLEILICMGEESPGITATFGSKLVTGHYALRDLQKMTLAYDRSTSVVEAINNYFTKYDKQPDFRFDEEKLNTIQLNKEEYLIALEIHIEQFLLLQNLADKDNGQPYVGVMRGVGGHIRKNVYLEDKGFEATVNKRHNRSIQLTFKGKASHSGATPMGEYRDDALVKASAFLMRLSLSQWVQKGEISFSDFTIDHPALTSVPSEVIVVINVSEGDLPGLKAFIELYAQGVMITYPETVALPISSNLVFDMAKIGDKMHLLANEALPQDEVRGTVTRVQFDAPDSVQCFCDIRGATLSGMNKVMDDIENMALKEGVSMASELISQKAPAIFDKAITEEVEELLEIHFDGRIMKGSISVPGQDIGIFSSYGIPSSLLFIESGTGHHPHEYVREEAMDQAFDALKVLVMNWNKQNI